MAKIGIKVDHGRLAFRYRYGGKVKGEGRSQQYLALGLSDSAENRTIAEGLRVELQKAIESGTHDAWVEKLKGREGVAEARAKKPKLLELWQKYTEFKSDFLANTTKYRD
jgi:hypothetical protein